LNINKFGSFSSFEYNKFGSFGSFEYNKSKLKMCLKFLNFGQKFWFRLLASFGIKISPILKT